MRLLYKQRKHNILTSQFTFGFFFPFQNLSRHVKVKLSLHKTTPNSYIEPAFLMLKKFCCKFLLKKVSIFSYINNVEPTKF